MSTLPKVSDLTDDQLNILIGEELNLLAHEWPKYTESLDAMGTAERTLGGENQWAYIEVLQDILGTIFTYDIATARAKQRAQAFVVATGRAEL